MQIRANDVYRAVLHKAMSDIMGADAEVRGRALVDFADFVMSDVSSEGATAIKGLLEMMPIESWDQDWVVPEVARATLDALNAWRSVADALLVRLKDMDQTETTRELQNRLQDARRILQAA